MTRREKQAAELAKTIMLAQFTPANVRAWMRATPFTICPAWNDYVEHMIGSIAGPAYGKIFPRDEQSASGEVE